MSHEESLRLPQKQRAVTEKFTRAIFNSLSTHICVLDSTGILLEANRAWLDFAHASGLVQGEVMGKLNYLDLYDQIIGPVAEEIHAFTAGIRAVQKGELREFIGEYQWPSADQKHWFLGRVIPFGNAEREGVLVSHEDITPLKLAEEKIVRLNRLYSALSETNQTIVRVHDRSKLLQEICRIAVEYARFRFAWIGFLDPDTRLIMPVAVAGDDAGYLRTTGISLDGDPQAKHGATLQAIRNGVYCICNDFKSDPISSPSWLEQTRKAGVRATAAFPIHEEGLVIGALTVYAGEAQYFDEALTRLLNEMAVDISFGLDMIAHEAQRELALQALKLSEVRYRSIFTSMAVGWGLTDLTGKFVEFNDTWCNMLGYQPAELSELNVIAITHPEDRAATRGYWQRLITGEFDHFRLEKRYLRKDGNPCWCDVTVSAYRDTEGVCRGIIGLVLDISERKQTEAQLYLRTNALEATANSIAITDRDGVIQWVNPAFTALTGYTAAEVVGQNPRVLKSGQHDQAYFQKLWNTILRGGTWHGEIVNRRKDGVLYTEEMTITPVRLGEDITHFIAIKQDVTARKRAESELVEAEAKFRALVEQSIAGIYILDSERFLYVNQRCAEIFGYQPAEVVQLSVSDLVTDTDQELVAENIRKRLAGTVSDLKYTFVGKRKDASLVDIGVHGVGTVYQGRPAIIGILQDIGERKQAEKEIQNYIARLERAMLSTVEAVAMMSELRDPYTSGHEHRVGDLAAAIGQEMGLPEETVKGLRIIGTVHDIGKITIPAEILSKPGKLSKLEFDIIKTHAQQGYEILKAVEFPWPVAQTILQHHERLDGSGYPQGLRATEIILEARILAVADVVEAMASHRPYRPGLGVEAALQEILQRSDSHYDASVVAACVRLFREQGYAFRNWPGR